MIIAYRFRTHIRPFLSPFEGVERILLLVSEHTQYKSFLYKFFLCSMSSLTPSLTMQYLINEMAIHCLKVATDPNGSRVLQSCMLLYQGEYRVHLFAEIIANALHLAEDCHGFV